MFPTLFNIFHLFFVEIRFRQPNLFLEMANSPNHIRTESSVETLWQTRQLFQGLKKALVDLEQILKLQPLQQHIDVKCSVSLAVVALQNSLQWSKSFISSLENEYKS